MKVRVVAATVLASASLKREFWNSGNGSPEGLTFLGIGECPVQCGLD